MSNLYIYPKDFFTSSKIQLHYWMKNDEHSIDALIQNKCELEFIKLLYELSKTFDCEYTIETEALAEGGIIRWFKLALKSENKQAPITIAVISAMAITVFTTPITTAISKTTEILIEKIFEDELDIELKQLEIEEKKLEIEGKKLDNEEKKQRIEQAKLEIESKKQGVNEKIQKIESNPKIKKFKSNFFEEIEKEKKIEKISLVSEDLFKKPNSEEKFIPKEKFKEFILASNEVETEPVEDAIIEIISPVLKKGDYKWKGIYEGKAISFNMKSNEFKTLIQTGQIEFKNGSAINCVLDISKEIDNEGEEKIVAYNILRVNHYFENDKPIETPEGKKQRQKKEADENQLGMFDDIV